MIKTAKNVSYLCLQSTYEHLYKLYLVYLLEEAREFDSIKFV